ncbi:MAG: SpoIIE family protein phosphatase [Bacteroidia bacterium]|nr:SpoIIE family protein phosphatase [Bacteroidia bacterium]
MQSTNWAHILKLIGISWVIGFLSLFAQLAVAQTLAFENYTVETGFKSPQVLGIFQSHDNTIWICSSNALNRFDGKSFTSFNEKNGLLSNVVFSINQDKKLRYLVGTYKGLNISIDGRTFGRAADPDSIAAKGVLKVFIDSRGRILLGTADGVGELKDTVVVRFAEKTQLDGKSIMNIDEDREGNLWFSTTKGIFKLDSKSNITKFDGFNGIVYNAANAVFEVGGGVYWFLCYSGLYEYNSHHLPNPTTGIPELKHVVIPGLSDDSTKTKFFAYSKDKQGGVWLGAEDGLYYVINRQAIRYTEADGLVTTDIFRIFEDKEGNMWFGSKRNGISKLLSRRFLNYKHKGLNGEIEALYKDHYGTIYAGSPEGGFVLRNNHFDSITGIKIPFVSSILVLEDQEQLFGNRSYIYRYNGKTFKELPYKSPTRGIYKVKSFKMLETNLHEVLVATNNGVWKIDRDSIRLSEGLRKYIGEEIVHDLYQDEKGNIWVGTAKGLKIFTYPDYLPVVFSKLELGLKLPVKQIVRSDAGEYFFATDNGMFRWDGKELYKYNDENSALPNNQVVCIAIDKAGVIWVGLGNGIARIYLDKTDKRKISVRSFDLESGFNGQSCLSRSICIDDKTGHIYFGTPKGIVVFRPEYDIPNTTPPYLMFTDIQLLKDTADWSLFEMDSMGANNLPIGVKLPYNKNHLTFKFVGVSNYYPLKIRYQYYLKGYEKTWREPTTKNEETYPELPPGDYEFFVKSCNADGVWNAEPISFKFTIEPPFYRTWWFYGIIGLIIASGIFSYIQINLANRKITSQNEQISRQKELIEKKNNEVLDSINYAKTIQEAILPPDRSFIESFTGAFVLYVPKDIVSGDFYWIEKIGKKVVFAVVDCTGHGVPGAFMSIVGHNALNQAVKENKILSASKILDYLNNYVNETLHTANISENGRKVRDGMDMSLCVFDTETLVIEFAGAYNPLVLIRDQELTEIKADRRPIGSTDLYGDQMFKNNVIQLQRNDRIYLFSDGYADQFGGPEGKKFYKGRFKETLKLMQGEPMAVQKAILIETFTKWKGDFEQVDDICIIGVQV